MLASLAGISFDFRVTAPELKAVAEVFEGAGFGHALDLVGAGDEFILSDNRLDGRLKTLAANIVNALPGSVPAGISGSAVKCSSLYVGTVNTQHASIIHAVAASGMTS